MTLQEKLRNIVEDNTTRAGRVFDTGIMVLILLSLVSFALETLPNLSEAQERILDSFEVFCVLVFTIEYFIRISVAEKPLKYILSFYGIIDLAAILPFYLIRVLDLRMLRAFRILRIFRAFKLVRFNRALQRIDIAIDLIKEELILFFIVTAIFIYISAAGIYFFENEAQPEQFQSVFHSLWWAVVTLTTVGYGDVYPITIGGRIFTFFMLIVGVGIVTVPAGLVASSFSKARELQDSNESLKSSNDYDGQRGN